MRGFPLGSKSFPKTPVPVPSLPESSLQPEFAAKPENLSKGSHPIEGLSLAGKRKGTQKRAALLNDKVQGPRNKTVSPPIDIFTEIKNETEKTTS